MLFGGFKRKSFSESPEEDPRIAAINKEAEEIRKSVLALEAQATVMLGKNYHARRINT